jgi:hypothetical protein
MRGWGGHASDGGQYYGVGFSNGVVDVGVDVGYDGWTSSSVSALASASATVSWALASLTVSSEMWAMALDVVGDGVVGGVVG